LARPRSQTSESSPFYGYTYQAVMAACLVTKQCAMRWRAGTGTPSPQALKLWSIFRDGRLVSALFKGWFFNEKDGELVTPQGDSFKPSEIQNIPLLYQQLSAQRAEIRSYKQQILELEYRNQQQQRQLKAYIRRPKAKCSYSPNPGRIVAPSPAELVSRSRDNTN
jgi:hypothetical protein